MRIVTHATCRLTGWSCVYTPAGEAQLAGFEGASFRRYVAEADVAGYNTTQGRRW
jgi:hypothetical protein